MPYERRAGDPPEGTWLPKDQLEPYAWYVGKCRNSIVAQWMPTRNHFIYIRHKFGSSFIEELPHPEDDAGFDCFFPFVKVVSE